MKMSPEEKAAREKQRLLDKSLEYQTSTYLRKFVAPLFQKMIRAEAGAHRGRYAAAFVPEKGIVMQVERKNGQCVCVTCGKVDAWDSGIKGMHTGHFLASRRTSILLEEENCAPQCSSCNYYGSGRASEFREWMLKMRGEKVIERLQNLKRQSVSFAREELVDMRIEFSRRLKAAIATMEGKG